MKDSDVFWYWIKEREEIRKKKEAGAPWPWTRDPVLQEFRFTNVFREHDAVTKWIRPLREQYIGDASQIHRILAARFFNRIDVLQELDDHALLDRDPLNTIRIEAHLREWRPKGPWTTGAYIINSPNGMDKLAGVCWMIRQGEGICHELYDQLIKIPPYMRSLEASTKFLTQIPHVANFMAYEVVTDLRHTPLLEEAADIHTWANPGPGAKRGLNRFFGRPAIKASIRDSQAINEMRKLLALSAGRLRNGFPSMEMRDIEHSLCEYDKYMRVKRGEGRPRQRYKR